MVLNPHVMMHLFASHKLFSSLIHTCVPACSVFNSLVNNNKSLTVLPRGRSVGPPAGIESILSWITTVLFQGTQTNIRDKDEDSLSLCLYKMLCFSHMSWNDQHSVKKEVGGGTKEPDELDFLIKDTGYRQNDSMSVEVENPPLVMLSSPCAPTWGESHRLSRLRLTTHKLTRVRAWWVPLVKNKHILFKKQ